MSSNTLSIGQKLYLKNVSNNVSSDGSTYVVKSGDTLYSIAKKNGITVDHLKKLNNLSSNLLSIGDVLMLPDKSNVYIVQSGDTLYGIAQKFNASVNDIKAKNNLQSNIINVGQELVIN